MTNNRSVSAAAGEYLALGELLKRGKEAYLAQGQQQKGWDIAVIASPTSIKRVQVKTIDWPRKTAVNGNFTDGFDYLVVVLLDRENPRSRFLIFPVADLSAFISPPNTNRQDNARTLTISNSAMKACLSKYIDKWESISSTVICAPATLDVT